MQNIKEFFNSNDFRSGEYDEYFTANAININYSEHVPLNPSSLSEREIYTITKRLPQFPFILSKWKGVVNANDLEVVIARSEGVSERTSAARLRLNKSTYNLIYNTNNWNNVESQVVELLAREGMAIIRLNNEGKPVVDSKFRYDIYFDAVNHTVKADYKDPYTNIPVAGLKGLIEGQEIFIIRHPAFEQMPVPFSSVDCTLLFTRLENHAVTVNQKIFDQGMIGQLFLKIAKEGQPSLAKSVLEEKNKTKNGPVQKLLRAISDQVVGKRNANKVNYFPYLEDVMEKGRSNDEMQFSDIIKNIVPERVAWAFLLTAADFGSGKATTYNNVATFDKSLYAKCGRSIEKQLARALNNWLLPIKGITTSPNFYVQYNEPADTSEEERRKVMIEEWKNNIITLNEYREKQGMESVENGDRYYSEVVQSEPAQEQFTIDAQIVQPRRTMSFTDALNYRATTVDQAIASEEYTGKKGIQKKFERAIKKQIEDYAKKVEELADLDNLPNITPLETFYSFPALEKSLLEFAGLGLDDYYSDKRVTQFKKEYFDGEYPAVVLSFIEEQVQRILKGDKKFESVDAETASQIETIISENIEQGVNAIAMLIKEKAKDMSLNRAKLIAQTEVANAVEGTRELMYVSDPLFKDGGKEWQTSLDERVRLSHKRNSEQGVIPIAELFQNGSSRAGSEPRCRCDTVYYTAEEFSDI